MSFFKNPQYNSIKVLLLLVLIVGSGYFVFSNSANRGVDQTGKTFFNKKNTIQDNGPQAKKIIVWGGTGECTVVFDDGSYIDGTTEYNADGTFKGCRDGDGNLWQPGMPGVVEIEYDGPKSEEAMMEVAE